MTRNIKNTLTRKWVAITGTAVFSGLNLIGCSSPFDLDRIHSTPFHIVDFQAASPDDVADAYRQATADEPLVTRTSSRALSDRGHLADYLEYAALKNPGLQAAFYRWRAALEKVPQVTALPEPRLTYGYFLNEVETRVGPQQHRLSLMQMFPWFGELELRGDMASRNAMAAFERMRGEIYGVFQDVREAWYELYYLGRAVSITQESLDLLKRFEEVAVVRYQTASAAYPDVIRVQVEIGKLEDRLRRFRDMIAPTTARLNAVLNRQPKTVVELPDSIDTEYLIVDETAIHDQLRASNPMLRAIEQEIERARIGTDLARLQYYPDFSLGLMYTVTNEAMNPNMPESGDDPLLASITLNLPIRRDKYDAAVRESIAKRLGMSRQLAEAQNDIKAKIEKTLFDLRDAGRQMNLYRNTLLPKARQSLDASLTAYQGGKAGFLDLVDAQRALLQFELSYERAVTNRAQALARLERIAGRPVIQVKP